MKDIIFAAIPFYTLLLGIIGMCVWANTLAPHFLWFVGIGIVVLVIIVTTVDFVREIIQ